MALSRVTTWTSGQVLTASALNGELNNILDNALSLISPLTGALNFNGNTLQNLALGAVGSPGLYFSSDSNTGLYQSAADIIDFALGGVRGFQIASALSGVNWILATPSATAVWPTLSAQGNDTNIGVRIESKGTAYVAAKRGRSIGENFWPSFGFYDEHGRAEVAGVMQIAAGTLDLVAGGRRVLQASAYADATNYLRVRPGKSGETVLLDVAGGNVNGLEVATAFVAASAMSPPTANALYRENIVKGWISFKGTTTASIYGSFNVTSLARDATGEYTITWDRDFAATPYAIAGLSIENTSLNTPVVGISRNGAISVGAISVTTEVSSTNAAADSELVTLIAVGRQ